MSSDMFPSSLADLVPPPAGYSPTSPTMNPPQKTHEAQAHADFVMAGSLPTMATGVHKRSVLKRMYESADWADLTINSGTKWFRVHKSVICPASAFFHAACTHAFKEKETGEITVEEDAITTDAILRHFYELPVDWLTTNSGEFNRHSSTVRREWLERMLTLRQATDKYDMPDLTKLIHQAFTSQLAAFFPLKDIIEVGALLIDEDMPFDAEMRNCLKTRIAPRLDELRKDEQLWDIVYEDKEYMKLVFDAAIQLSERLKGDSYPDISPYKPVGPDPGQVSSPALASDLRVGPGRPVTRAHHRLSSAVPNLGSLAGTRPPLTRPTTRADALQTVQSRGAGHRLPMGIPTQPGQ